MEVVYKLPCYEIISIIGKGTYGTVFLSRNRYNHMYVALKEITVVSTNDILYKETQNEIKILSTLQHPHIIRYFDNFYENKSVYIVMEYATNGNLAQYMFHRQHYLLPQNQIMYFFYQILLGVHHIHQKNVIHRDIKAENIFLAGPTGLTVKIGDFGIAKLLGKDKTTTVIGTPYYLAPELCQNYPYDMKTDIWALGCLLYEMCTHRRAFDSPTLVGLVNQITTGSFIPINRVYYDIELQNIIDEMLTVVPEKRASVENILNKNIWLSMFVSVVN